MHTSYYNHQHHSVASPAQFGSSDGTTTGVATRESAAIPNCDDDPTVAGSGSAVPGYPRAMYGSRYKLMSPAKLPISRPPCLTIPPGLSPSSLLDSPVLLSNVKVESSPTTGSLQKPQAMYGIIGSSVLFSSTNDSSIVTRDERNLSNFDSKHHNPSNLGWKSSSAAPLASAGLTSQQCERFVEVQDQGQPHSLTSLPSVEMQKTAASSRNLDLSATTANQPLVSRVTLGNDQPTEISLQNQVFHPVAQALHPDHKESNSASVTSEKSSDDGYNWRKYGQKLVKGSEFPRSYYKCTHPNCQVKKLFERSNDGTIAEIIYKGKHDHPKPQPRRRFPVEIEENLDKFSLNNAEDNTSIAHGQTFCHSMPDGNPELPPVSPSDGNLDDNKDDDDPDSKRRKQDLGVDVISLVKPTREPRVVVQTMSEVDILDDGYRWRKYGQKVVKGNPNPRSYYKCTNAGCPVRKHVERASHDLKAVVTTYEGKHNHDVPVSRSSNHDKGGTSMYTMCADASIGTRLEESDAISLDLGVAIGFTYENGSNETKRRMEAESAQTQIHGAGSASMPFQATPVSTTYYGVYNDDDQYEIRDNPGGNFRFETSTVKSSNSYPQSMGSLLMGPYSIV